VPEAVCVYKAPESRKVEHFEEEGCIDRYHEEEDKAPAQCMTCQLWIPLGLLMKCKLVPVSVNET
jgi:hypothetical protein